MYSCSVCAHAPKKALSLSWRWHSPVQLSSNFINKSSLSIYSARYFPMSTKTKQLVSIPAGPLEISFHHAFFMLFWHRRNCTCSWRLWIWPRFFFRFLSNSFTYSFSVCIGLPVSISVCLYSVLLPPLKQPLPLLSFTFPSLFPPIAVDERLQDIKIAVYKARTV